MERQPNGQFANGNSGGPGRPRKKKALSEILQTAANKTTNNGQGKRTARKRLIAELVMQGLTSGLIQFPGGRKYTLDFDEWRSLLNFFYNRVEGKPTERRELAGDVEQPIAIRLDI